jgi:RecA-family ATPase
VIGKAKSKKSFFINIAISAVTGKDLLLGQFRGCLAHDKRTVLYFDTEQGKYHVQLALKRICAQINLIEPENLKVYGLRPYEPLERLKMIEYAITHTENLGFVVIDGIKDLVTSINDEEQATMLTPSWMMKIIWYSVTDLTVTPLIPGALSIVRTGWRKQDFLSIL